MPARSENPTAAPSIEAPTPRNPPLSHPGGGGFRIGDTVRHGREKGVVSRVRHRPARWVRGRHRPAQTLVTAGATKTNGVSWSVTAPAEEFRKA